MTLVPCVIRIRVGCLRLLLLETLDTLLHCERIYIAERGPNAPIPQVNATLDPGLYDV